MDNETGVCEFLCDRRFHQSFILPPNPDTSRSKPLRVSYADYGDPDSDAIVLMCGGVSANRFCYSPLDQLAKTNHVRIIHPDRPGVGGTDKVELHMRIPVWLEMIPQLLAHLGIKHVALASHSGGVIYALNIILTHPHLLHPSSPYVAFFSPWVHPQHTGIPQLKIVQRLPKHVIAQYGPLFRFLSDKIIPLAGSSGALVHSIKDVFHHPHTIQDQVPLVPVELSPRSSRVSVNETSGLDLNNPAVTAELRKWILTYLFAERTDGMSADAQLLLKPHSNAGQTPTADLDYILPLLVQKIRKETEDEENGRAWLIEAFHPQHDSMIGPKGRLWFDECWGADDTSASELDAKIGGSLDYRSTVVARADHRYDYILDPAFGASSDWLKRVRGVFPAELADEIEAICPAGSNKRYSFAHLLQKIKEYPCPIRTKVKALRAAHDAYALLDTLGSVDDCSSITALRKGKLGGRKGVLDKYEIDV